jgi:hypothetical protein
MVSIVWKIFNTLNTFPFHLAPVGAPAGLQKLKGGDRIYNCLNNKE